MQGDTGPYASVKIKTHKLPPLQVGLSKHVKHRLVSHTTTEQLDALRHHAFFQGHLDLLPARLAPKLHPKPPADTYLMGTRSSEFPPISHKGVMLS